MTKRLAILCLILTLCGCGRAEPKPARLVPASGAAGQPADEPARPGRLQRIETH